MDTVSRQCARVEKAASVRFLLRSLSRAWDILRWQGLFVLMRELIRRYVLDVRSFFLYEHEHRRWPERFASLPDGFEECFVDGNAAADRVAATHSDVRDLVPAGHLALASGAVAFCLYHGSEIAHVGWVATSEAARRSIDRLGYEVRFDRGEAWTGAAFTVPRFRSRGLLTYSCLRRFDYLRESGFPLSRAAVATDNAASHRVTMLFEPRVYAIGRQFRLFRWRRWTERPVRPSDHH